jgi:hypothetical protein
MPEPRQLARDSPVPPGRVLPRHPDDQRLDRSAGRRPSWPTPAGVVPPAGNEVTVPAQERGRDDRQDLRPPAAAQQPRQRRKPEPVGIVPPQPTAELTAQHLVFVAQHQQLGVLGQIRPDQHRQQADQVPHQAVDDRQQHPEMVPATPLILQQNPSSRRETEFPSGTASARRPKDARRTPSHASRAAATAATAPIAVQNTPQPMRPTSAFHQAASRERS